MQLLGAAHLKKKTKKIPLKKILYISGNETLLL